MNGTSCFFMTVAPFLKESHSFLNILNITELFKLLILRGLWIPFSKMRLHASRNLAVALQCLDWVLLPGFVLQQS